MFSSRAEKMPQAPEDPAPVVLEIEAPPHAGAITPTSQGGHRGQGEHGGHGDHSTDEDGCKTGCSLAKHDIPPFSFGQFVAARAAYAKEAPDAPSKSLETLLFYRHETLLYLKKNGTAPLSPEHAAFLSRELRRETATVSIRVVGMNGKIRVALQDVVVPLGVKQHLRPEALDGTQPLSFNGTVKRVGLYHLWSRY